jgi:dUTP pyrophosphatase
VRARSGLAVKHGIGLVNGVGTIDSDYRGEIKVPLINWGSEPYKIEKGDRIAQLIIAKYERIDWDLVEGLEQTKRNENGFGSSGK